MLADLPADYTFTQAGRREDIHVTVKKAGAVTVADLLKPTVKGKAPDHRGRRHDRFLLSGLPRR